MKNAIFYQNKKFAFLIEEKDLNDKLLKLITKINSNRAILKEIIKNQSQYSDKNVYNNINLVLKDLNDEKINLGQNEVIHFVGIGGIGMSGLAQIMKNMGLKFKEAIKSEIKIP